MKEVIVYTTPWCAWCKKLKAFLDVHNIRHTERDVEKDHGALRDLAEKSNQTGVPVLVAGDDVVIGFDKRRLKKVLGLS